jgi:hypothetical protein
MNEINNAFIELENEHRNPTNILSDEISPPPSLSTTGLKYNLMMAFL